MYCTIWDVLTCYTLSFLLFVCFCFCFLFDDRILTGQYVFGTAKAHCIITTEDWKAFSEGLKREKHHGHDKNVSVTSLVSTSVCGSSFTLEFAKLHDNQKLDKALELNSIFNKGKF